MDTTTKQQLFDAIFDDPNRAFPEFDWERDPKFGWRSPYHITNKMLGGRYSDFPSHKTIIKDGKEDAHCKFFDQSRGDAGEYVEILTYWKQVHNDPHFSDLFRLYGMEPPRSNPEQERREKELKTDTERLLAAIRADYLGAPGEAVRAYLAAPIQYEEIEVDGKKKKINVGGRQYDAATVSVMGDFLGVITDGTADTLARITGLPIPKNVARTHPVVILTISKNGAIQYAKFRSINPQAQGREKWHNPTKDAPKNPQYYFYYPNEQSGKGRDDVDPYNYNHTSFLAQGGSRTVVIVESEICAAHATAKGIKNVIAVRGSDGVKQHIANRLISNGCTKAVILMDDDEKGRQAARKCVHDILQYEHDLIVRVATIPADLDAKDPDELLAKHPDGAALLQSIIDNATTAEEFTARQLADRYKTTDDPDERERIERELVRECAALHSIGEYIAEEKLANKFCTLSGAMFIDTSVERQAAILAEEQAMARYEKRQKQAFDALDKARKSNDQQAIRDALAELSDMRPPMDDPELTQAGGTIEQAFAELYKDAAKDIETSYKLFTKDPEKEGNYLAVPVKLFSNGITYFGGGTGHGKTQILQNIALDVLEQGKTIVYYTFEENKRDTFMGLLNIYAHKYTPTATGNVSNKGTRYAMNEYFLTRNPNVFDNLHENGECSTFAAAIDGFFKRFRGMGDGDGKEKQRLFIYEDKLTSAELVEHVERVAARVHPDAIFIDYVQFLNADKNNPSAQQFEDLGRVSKDLIDINKTLGVPIVCAAQLKEKNNEKDTPSKLSYTDIFGASTIAQGASSIYLIGNGSKYVQDKETLYLGANVPFGQKNFIYMSLVKNRFGASPAVGIYDYDGAKRYIRPDTLMGLERARGLACTQVKDQDKKKGNKKDNKNDEYA